MSFGYSLPRAALARTCVIALALAGALACPWAVPAHASTASERPLLGVDRSDLALGDAQWDELQEELRQTRTYSPAAFAARSVDLAHPSPASADECGASLAMGDVNGDGLSDVVMGCPMDDTAAGADAGSVVVLLRNSTNTAYLFDRLLLHPTPVADDRCGFSVAVGDVNADGRGDVVAGCYLDDAGGFNAGGVAVFTRNAANTDFDAGIEYRSPTPASGDYCGVSVAAGDVNGDGRDDIALGCHGDATDGALAGRVVVGVRNLANTGFDTGVELAHPTPAANDECGRSVAIGDINADGRADVAFGCHKDDTGGNDAGSVVVRLRDAANTGFDIGTELGHATPAAGDTCGFAVGIGDVNADARGDVVMGCPFDDTGAADAGSAVVLTRNSANTGYDAGQEIGAATAGSGDDCGWSVAVGDATGDARSDVAIGCYLGGGSAGHVVLRPRNVANDGFDTGPLLTHQTLPGVGNRCGYSVAMGDGNGDGRLDIGVGCLAAGLGGVAAVIDAAGQPTTLTHPSPVAGDDCGDSVATGDVDGDGSPEVVLGCDSDDTGAVDAGSAVVLTRSLTTRTFGAGVEFGHPTPGGSDFCGKGVAVGDINGDGKDDLLIGCPYDDVGAAADAGSVVVRLRNVANTGFDPGIELWHPTPAANQRCGFAVAAGDVNGDGRADVVIGCRGDATGGADAGSVVVVTRNAANNGFDPGVELRRASPAAGDQCGFAVATGDVNGDGRDDVAMGCNLEDTGGASAGSVIVLVRNPANDGFLAGDELRHPSATAGDQCGSSVATGDVNGDGRSDILMGCTLDDFGGTDTGSVVVRTRNAANSGFDPGAEYGHPSAAPFDYCGESVAAGDVNGDGRADILIGCLLDDTGGADAGSVVVRTRNSANGGFDPGIEFGHTSPAAGDRCGSAVMAPDVDADGRSDVLIGCQQRNTGPGVTGDAILHMSTSRGVAGTVGTSRRGDELLHPTAAAGDGCGYGVAAGDINGDGRGDVATGCYRDDDGALDGGSVVVTMRNGGNSGFAGGTQLLHPSPASGDTCGYAVAVGDVNADGLSDVAMGCPNDDTPSLDAGSVILFVRNPANSGFLTAIQLDHPTPAAADLCGNAVAIGDVNGDGRGDVIVGCPGDDTGASQAGSAIIFVRDAANTGFLAGVEFGHPAPAASDSCGAAVATGDVNADGRDDVLLGCSNDDTGGVDTGSAVLLTRNAGNTSFDVGVEVGHPSPSASDKCGSSVGIGDLDADRRGDLVIGCFADDAGAVDSGSAFVALRNATNNGFTAGIVLTRPSPSTNDFCGSSVATGDVDGDGLGDVAMSCVASDFGAVADSGSVVTLTRNASNSGFSGGAEAGRPAPVAADACGYAVALADLNDDGREDVVLGCEGADVGAAEAGLSLVLADRSTRIVSRRLNVRSAASISAATVTVAAVANGAAPPRLEASANAGGTWESVVNGVSHTFTTTGTDLRVRVALPQAPTAQMVQAVHDLAVSYTYVPANVAPIVPVLSSPAAGASTADTTPDLAATFSDPDTGDTGTIGYEVCSVAMAAGQTCAVAGGSVLATGSSPSGIAIGFPGTWTVTPALVPGIVHWHARATDNGSLVSAWSASRQLTIQETVTIGVDSATVAMGAILPSSNATANTLIDVQSNDPQGYTLAATDESDTWGADCICGGTIADWTGPGTAPTLWTAPTGGTNGYMGATVRDTTGQSDNRLAKWGTVNAAGWPATDFANNLYAGLKLGTSVVLHTTSAAAPADTIAATWRVNTTATTQPGSYDATIALTATGNP